MRSQVFFIFGFGVIGRAFIPDLFFSWREAQFTGAMRKRQYARATERRRKKRSVSLVVLQHGDTVRRTLHEIPETCIISCT